MQARPLFVAGFAVLALTGIALAAESQLETFLKPAELSDGFGERAAVQGNLVALTAFLVAAAMTAGASVMASTPWRARLLPLAAIFLGSYILVVIVQTAMFNYQAIDVTRSATFNVSPLFTNAAASPSVFIGPLAVIMACAIGVAAAGRQLVGGGPVADTPTRALHAYLAALTLAVPFLVVLAWGNLRVLLALPDDDPAILVYLFVMPLTMLAGIGLLVVMLLKAWHLGSYVRNPRLGVVAQDAWMALRRAEWVGLGLLVGLAVLAVVLEPVQHAVLEADRVFGLTARSHAQAAALVAVILVPALGLHRPITRLMEKKQEGSIEVGGHPLVLTYLIATGLSFVAAGLGTWLLEGALWPWVFASAPVVALCLTKLAHEHALQPGLFLATLLWGIGNTIQGDFELIFRSTIDYHANPGLLALWRALAVVLVAWAVARAARAQTAGMGRRVAWPLTSGLGAMVALIIFLELPFSAWVIQDFEAEYVGIGTVVASQETPVRAVIHGVAGMAAFLSGLAVARLHRPDWFRREPAPVPSVAAVPDAE